MVAPAGERYLPGRRYLFPRDLYYFIAIALQVRTCVSNNFKFVIDLFRHSPNLRLLIMAPPKKSKKDEGQPGSSSAIDQTSDKAHSSSEEDNIPLAQRKDAKAKMKKSGKVDSSEAAKVPKGNKGSSGEASASKVPKGKFHHSVESGSSNVVNPDDQSSDEASDEEGQMQLTPAEVAEGWSVSRRRRVMKVNMECFLITLSSYNSVQMSKIVIVSDFIG